MATLFRDGKELPQNVAGKIVRLFHRLAHPVYMGIVSLEIGWSLARTQEILEHLSDEGVVRAMSPDEKITAKFPEDANLYVLIGAPRLNKAWF
jgi:hypothetical protein